MQSDDTNFWSRRDPLSLVSEAELAARWHRSRRTLQRWRKHGSGPVYIRVGRTVLYRIEDVLAFEAESLCGAEAVT